MSVYLNGTQKSNVLFFLKDKIVVPKDFIEVKMSLVVLQAPASFYVINTTNNTLVINNVSYSLPLGNYNIQQLVTLLTTLLGNTYNITFNSNTNKLTFTSTLNQNFTFNKSSTCFNLLGFSSGDKTSTSYILTGDQVVNLTGTNCIFFSTENITTKNIDSQTGITSTIIASIPVECGQGGIVFYKNNTDTKVNINERHIDYLNIAMYDEYRNYIDFNNCDWTATLQFDIVYYFDPSKHLESMSDLYGGMM